MSAALRQFSEYPPLTLYVHLPWCEKKCPYCDFNSHPAPAEIPEREYLQALQTDLEQHAPDIWGRAVTAIFIGGGTPSLLSAAGLDALMGKIRALTRLDPDAEITLEANPGSAERARFANYRESGINRLSIGVQSFDDDCLLRLGRIHDAASAQAACRGAAEAGFDNFNIDLMHGLPQQDPATARRDMQIAIDLQPTHISYYQLTIEPNTLFASSPPPLPDEDALWSIQQIGQELLAANHYRQYEVSAYAQAGFECAHNLNYWRFGDYLGIGAGAHSKLTFAADSSIQRFSKQRHPARYMQTASGPQRIQSHSHLNNADARFEFLMNALRLNDGFPAHLFADRTGEPLHSVEEALARAEELELITRDHRQIEPTELGRRHLDSLLQLFMPPAEAVPAQSLTFRD